MNTGKLLALVIVFLSMANSAPQSLHRRPGLPTLLAESAVEVGKGVVSLIFPWRNGKRPGNKIQENSQSPTAVTMMEPDKIESFMNSTFAANEAETSTRTQPFSKASNMLQDIDKISSFTTFANVYPEDSETLTSRGILNPFTWFKKPGDSKSTPKGTVSDAVSVPVINTKNNNSNNLVPFNNSFIKPTIAAKPVAGVTTGIGNFVTSALNPLNHTIIKPENVLGTTTLPEKIPGSNVVGNGISTGIENSVSSSVGTIIPNPGQSQKETVSPGKNPVKPTIPTVPENEISEGIENAVSGSLNPVGSLVPNPGGGQKEVPGKQPVTPTVPSIPHVTEQIENAIASALQPVATVVPGQSHKDTVNSGKPPINPSTDNSKNPINSNLTKPGNIINETTNPGKLPHVPGTITNPVDGVVGVITSPIQPTKPMLPPVNPTGIITSTELILGALTNASSIGAAIHQNLTSIGTGAVNNATGVGAGALFNISGTVGNATSTGIIQGHNLTQVVIAEVTPSPIIPIIQPQKKKGWSRFFNSLFKPFSRISFFASVGRFFASLWDTMVQGFKLLFRPFKSLG